MRPTGEQALPVTERAELFEGASSMTAPLGMENLQLVEAMTEAELDAELRQNGLDPEEVVQNAFSKVCELARTQAEANRDLEQRLQEAMGLLRAWEAVGDTELMTPILAKTKQFLNGGGK